MTHQNGSAVKDRFLKLRGAAEFTAMFNELYRFITLLDLVEQGRVKDNNDNDLAYTTSVDVLYDEFIVATFQLTGVEFKLVFSPVPTANCRTRPACYGIRQLKWLWNGDEFREEDIKRLCPAIAAWRPRNTDYWYCKAALALQLRKQQQTTDNTNP